MRLWTLLCLLLLAFTVLFGPDTRAEIDPQTGAFTYAGGGTVDEILGQIGLYLIDRHKDGGPMYTSREVETGIVGYQLRFFDNGNHLVDLGDWLSVRRYNIPAEPDTTRPAGYYKQTYLELVDVGLDGIDRQDYYFIDGRRFDLKDQPIDVLNHYQVQIESGITAYLRKVGYETILKNVGTLRKTAIKKDQAYEDGSLPSQMILGLDMRYVFRPIETEMIPLSEQEMIEEIRQHIGFVYSATVDYTDIHGYRFRDIVDQIPLVQRTYHPIEKTFLALVIESLFDTDGDGIITYDNLKNGYTRFREIHQQLAESARGQNRRIVLPNEKLARLQQEYESKHKKIFDFTP